MVKEINSTDVIGFKEEIKEGLILVDAFAPWCGPCKMIAPVLESVSDELTDIEFKKFSIDDYRPIANELGVKSIPTLIVYKDGVELDRISGFVPRDAMIKWIERSLVKGE